MSSTISILQLNQLRAEFRDYMRETHAEWSDSTIFTYASDAFYAFNNNVGVDFWSCFVSEDTLLDAKDRIQNFLTDIRKLPSAGVSQGTSGYYKAMKQLKTFLDEKHPELATEWSGKSVSDTYLKTAFQNWMRNQKKSNGESYKSGTISAYSNAIKNSTVKLGLGEVVLSDLFYYTDAAEFEKAHRAILAAPNFEEVDLSAGNKAYSSGMVLYGRFLEEYENSEDFEYEIVGDGSKRAKANFVKWFVPLITALKELGGSATPEQARNQIAEDLRLPDTVVTEIRGEKSTRKFDNEVAWARNYMAYEGLIDKSERGIWTLTDKGMSVEMTDELASYIVFKWIDILKNRRDKASTETPAKADVPQKKRFWMYAPGEGSRLWDEFYENGIMGIGWDEIGDLSVFPSKEAMKDKLRDVYGDDVSYKNAGHATWQFANEVKPGDVVFVKRGLHKIVGRGIVISSYIFDNDRAEYKHIHKVQWTDKGEWEHDGQIVLKTLTDITPYTDYYRKLEDMFVAENDDEVEPVDEAVHYDSYTSEDFLDDVYMSVERYNTLRGLLLKKKNIILQGAPGVGKTYAAERLAFSIMGEKDTSRVKIVQFHQSYSYEDFIMGYRPDGNGFSLAKGPFYEFCKEAEPDDREYFFIIDEINRGNLSKIFGELLMLIESDKRGEKHAIRLLYADEQFSVPENVHIIGMMNTADRSLAMIDYALRRRFAFFEFEPAFAAEGFKKYQASNANRKFDALIETVDAMNRYIAADTSLGSGFRVGHSYFCTAAVVDDAWLSDVVEFELVPLIKEYWFDEPAKVEQWSQKLRGAIHG